MRKTLILMASIAALSTSGCFAALVPMVAKIATVVSDATAVLSIIEQATSTWFKHRPNAELEQESSRLIVNAYTALRVANSTTSGADSLSQEEYDAAFKDFQEAYTELHSFLKDNGILKGTKLGLGNGKTEEIPPPLAMSLKVD